MTLERILLQTIKFDLQVEHPYTFLLKYAKCFKGDQQKLQKMVQMAWNFVNDSLSTMVCLQWESEIIAVALIHLASKLSKFNVHSKWWEVYVSDITMDIIEDICHQVLDLYQSNQKEQPESNSPPQKPPSRADSPTPIKGFPVNTASTGSPVAKGKSIPSITAAVPSGSSNVAEINNIQTIKSLVPPSVAPPIGIMPPQHDINHAALAAAYQMYSAPPMPPMNHAPPPPHAVAPPPPPAQPWHGPPPPASHYYSGPPPSYYPPGGRQQRY